MPYVSNHRITCIKIVTLNLAINNKQFTFNHFWLQCCLCPRVLILCLYTAFKFLSCSTRLSVDYRPVFMSSCRSMKYFIDIMSIIEYIFNIAVF
jgi:hypothetical protein